MKEKTGFATEDAARIWASDHGLSGYILSGPKADGSFTIKVMTLPPTEENLNPEQPE